MEKDNVESDDEYHEEMGKTDTESGFQTPNPPDTVPVVTLAFFSLPLSFSCLRGAACWDTCFSCLKCPF